MKLQKQFDKDVIVSVILYIVDKMGGTVDMHKIFKTLYFADRLHLAKYGRRITGDVYIAMPYGPVPSKTDDIFKAVRGDSYFSEEGEAFKKYFHFVNKYTVSIDAKPDTDYLSETDMECLDEAIEKCKNLTFAELTRMSHDFAWTNTVQGRTMEYVDIMREISEPEDYAVYVQEMINREMACC